jgi:hypothetical protein
LGWTGLEEIVISVGGGLICSIRNRRISLIHYLQAGFLLVILGEKDFLQLLLTRLIIFLLDYSLRQYPLTR